MSGEPKKKIMIKRKGGTKPAIKLNKPADEEKEPETQSEEQAPAVDSAGRKKVAFKKKSVAKPASTSETDEQDQPVEKQDSAPPPKSEPKEQESTQSEGEKSVSTEEAASKEEGTVFKFYCVYCGQKLSAHSSMAGKKITCPACKNKIEIPVPPA